MNDYFLRRNRLFIINYSLFIKKFPFRHSIQRLLLAPAAGYRSREAGVLTFVDTDGNYWSSSSYVSDGSAANLAGLLWFSITNIRPTDSGLRPRRANALSVRCVQHLPELLSLEEESTGPRTLPPLRTGSDNCGLSGQEQEVKYRPESMNFKF